MNVIPATAAQHRAFVQAPTTANLRPLRAKSAAVAVSVPVDKKPLVVVSIADFLATEFPPREEILKPWMLSQSLNMIYAWRGTGKTHASLGIAYALASGGEFLGWTAPDPRKVLFLDGEMCAVGLQERLALIAQSAHKEPPPGYLQILTPDLQSPEMGMPDLTTAEGQAAINEVVEAQVIEIIIVDNLSSLARGSGKENESESWMDVQGWALQMRASGRSVLFIHHSGKNGEQRGTSKREDLLDAVISLKQPSDYDEQQGARFEVRFKKSRNHYGKSLDPFEAWLQADHTGAPAWALKPLSETTRDRVVELAKEGLSDREIAQELGKDRTTIFKTRKKAEDAGLLPRRVAK